MVGKHLSVFKGVCFIRNLVCPLIGPFLHTLRFVKGAAAAVCAAGDGEGRHSEGVVICICMGVVW